MKQQTSTVTGQLLVELGREKQACQYPLASLFYLIFFLEKIQHLPIGKKVFQMDLEFSQHSRIFLGSFLISNI